MRLIHKDNQPLFKNTDNSLFTLITLFAVLLSSLILSGCTTSADSQLAKSVCEDCLNKTPFYRDGVWIEERKND